MSIQTIPLAGTGRNTTRLGYGCSSIMGGANHRESLRLLEAAFDAGIRHFDVAPSYGFGDAERALGDFLKLHPGATTITSKYGILPAGNRSLIGIARGIAVPIIRGLPGVKQRIARMARAAIRPAPRAAFTAEEARASLDRSLRELRADHLDLWLLHEARASDLQHDSLLELLVKCVSAGMIGSFGVGSGSAKIPDLFAQKKPYCRTLQFEWSVLDPIVDYPGSFQIHHRALFSYPTIRQALATNKDLSRRWSDEVGVDLSQDSKLAGLMLKTSLELYPDSIILFSSKKTQNIQANVATLHDDRLKASARRLYALVQREKEWLLGTASSVQV